MRNAEHENDNELIQKGFSVRRKKGLNSKSDVVLTLMTLPTLLKLFLFSYVTLIGLVMAFQDYIPNRGIFGSEFIGFSNFEFFFKSIDAQRVIGNTFFYGFLFLIVGLVTTVGLALICFEVKSKLLIKGAQWCFFLPYFISWSLTSIILMTFINSSGSITEFVQKITGNEIAFYQEASAWRIILPVMFVWKLTGVNAIVYYANMLSIDKELYEAAWIDGASRLKQAWHITLPQIKVMILVLTIMSLGNIIRSDFGIFYYLPRNSAALYPATDTIDTYVFRLVMGTYPDTSIATAVGLFQSLVGLVMVVGTNAVVRKINKSAALF